jgi:GGDEF domain-containing protein
VVTEASAEEKIGQAREWLMSSLQQGMEAAAGSDMEWIAYRRLMAGLKPVLPQTAAAVIAMNYHNEDLLLVEPKDAEPRFRMLLSQRASLLKNLSRSLGPQQIVIDFDGPEGPLPHVMLAVIPLPIERPGWGALVIERNQEEPYSEAELDLCTEFAALATTAADEAGEAMEARHAREVDASGGFRAEMLESQLARALEVSVQKRKPLGIMRVAIDNFDKLPAEAAPGLARSVANTLREEIDFGEAIVRRTPEEFVVLLAGRTAHEMRALGERICTEMQRHPLPGADGQPLTVSAGIAGMLAGERSTQMVMERSARALAKAQSYGGNQAQMVAGNQ